MIPTLCGRGDVGLASHANPDSYIKQAHKPNLPCRRMSELRWTMADNAGLHGRKDSRDLHASLAALHCLYRTIWGLASLAA